MKNLIKSVEFLVVVGGLTVVTILGEKGIEAFLNTQGYTMKDNAAYINVKRDHYRSGDGCKYMRNRACVIRPVIIQHEKSF